MKTRETARRAARDRPATIHDAVCVYEHCTASSEPGLPVDIYLCRSHFERIGQMYVVTSDRVKVVVEEEYEWYYVTDTQIDMQAKLNKMKIMKKREDHRKEEARLERRNKMGVEPDSVVYYLAFDSRVKIGTSSNLARRLTVVPHDEVLATEIGDYRLERQRHRQFRDSRLTGEWFGPSKELMMHIEMLKRQQAWSCET